jgi:translation initiation factor 2 beta subunit (eIF-2beta)/eIF-5
MIGQRVGVPGSLPPIAREIQLKFMRLKRDTFQFGRYRVGDRVRICSGVMTSEATVMEIDEKKRVRLRLDRPLCANHGERVAVLRRHEEAGRELLEGTGEIRRLWEWEAISTPDATGTPPDRVIEWIPVERTEFSRPPPPAYRDALDNIMSRKEELVAGASSLKIPQPDTDSRAIKKHVIWRNWLETVVLLDEAGIGEILYRAHFHGYFNRDLSTTSAENGEHELVIKGRWRTEDVRNVLRKYVTTYKRCAGCRGYNTGLVRAPHGAVKVRCARCVTDNVVDE